MVAPCHRLRGLQVREARHNPVGPLLRLRKQRAHQRLQPGLGRVDEYHLCFALGKAFEDREQFERTMETIRAFDAPISLVIEELDTEGMIDGIVEESGKVFIFTELGGGGTATPETVDIAYRGSLNVLHHFGILQGPPSLRRDRGETPSRFMATPDFNSYTIADETGLYECVVTLGEEVEHGQLIGRIHSIEKTGLAPGLYYANRSGVLIGRHFPGLARPGDCLAVVGIDEDPAVGADGQ